MQDPSSLTRDQNQALCITRQIFNHWTIREVPDRLLFTCQFVFLTENPQASHAVFLLGL